MGPSSIQITRDIHGHLLPSENKSTLDALDTPSRAPSPKIKAVTLLGYSLINHVVAMQDIKFCNYSL